MFERSFWVVLKQLCTFLLDQNNKVTEIPEQEVLCLSFGKVAAQSLAPALSLSHTVIASYTKCQQQQAHTVK